jgi:hypothetical protein
MDQILMCLIQLNSIKFEIQINQMINRNININSTTTLIRSCLFVPVVHY